MSTRLPVVGDAIRGAIDVIIGSATFKIPIVKKC
ncbi:MAG: hypothetical protein ACJAYG_000886 [Oceanicoccus sp.]|jgi:hypothetical protein